MDPEGQFTALRSLAELHLLQAGTPELVAAAKRELEAVDAAIEKFRCRYGWFDGVAYGTPSIWKYLDGFTDTTISFAVEMSIDDTNRAASIWKDRMEGRQVWRDLWDYVGEDAIHEPITPDYDPAWLYELG
jgi:hypothetical protein